VDETGVPEARARGERRHVGVYHLVSRQQEQGDCNQGRAGFPAAGT
jgi:hypothetical protein